jgi:hypothetical protein
MIKQLWSHTRNVNVSVFQHKVVYDIPLYNDLIFKNFKAEFRHGSMIITTFQEPTPPHSAKPSCDNPLIESVRLDETDKYSLSHQLVFHEMK